MTDFEKIARLYQLDLENTEGYDDHQISELETRLSAPLPLILKRYLRTLGQFNQSHNRLLPLKTFDFSLDGYLIFFEENQAVVYWGLRKQIWQKITRPFGEIMALGTNRIGIKNVYQLARSF